MYMYVYKKYICIYVYIYIYVYIIYIQMIGVHTHESRSGGSVAFSSVSSLCEVKLNVGHFACVIQNVGVTETWQQVGERPM